MDYRRLGRSDILVSAICLGSMNWGEQNSTEDGFAQMDQAVERGVNFIDSAEMYASPPRADTQGRSEEVIGAWMRRRGNRDKVIIATKAAGPDPRLTYLRDGSPRLDRKNLEAAVEASLKRLQSDYIDLYQLHWPDRPIKAFGELGYSHPENDNSVPLEESLAILGELVTAGKVRTIGVSNETPWGVMRFLALAEAGRGPRMASIQNPYSFLNRSFETSLAEIAIREDCGLLAYAPLAAGTLTGKYLNGRKPAGARLTRWPHNTRYQGPRAEAAIEGYVGSARRHGLDPAQMALSYVVSRPFVTSAIIGATDLVQLQTSLAAADLTLSDDVLDEIEALHEHHGYPCP